jgi:WD40 repeat protein
MIHLVVALSLVIHFGSATLTAPVPPPPPDFLPKGAIARLGSLAFRGPNLNGLMFSPDRRTLRATTGWYILGWDAKTGRPLPWSRFTPEGVEGLTGTTAIAGNRLIWIGTKGLNRIGKTADNTVVVTDFEKGELFRFTFPGLTFPGFLETAYHVFMTKAAVSGDGKQLAVFAEGDKTLRVYSLESGKQTLNKKLEVFHAPGVHISPDGSKVYYQELTKPVRGFDLRSGKALPELNAFDPSSVRIEVSPDAKVGVVRPRYSLSQKAGKPWTDPDRSELEVWDLDVGKRVGTLPLVATAQHFKFAGADGLLVVAARYRPELPTQFTISRWKLSTLRKEWEVPCPEADWLAISPDGKRFAVTDRQHVAHLYDASTGKRDAQLNGHDEPITWVGFSPDGETVITADQHSIWNWNLKGKGKPVATAPELIRGPKPLTVLGDRLAWAVRVDEKEKPELVGWEQARSLVAWRMSIDDKIPDRVFSPDGKRVVGMTWDADGKRWDVKVYDGPAGKRLYSWTMKDIPVWDSPWPVAFCEDGRLLYVGCRQGLIGLDVTTGKEKTRLDIGVVHGDHLQKPFPMAVSSDGNRIALVPAISSVEGNKHLLRVYDAKTASLIREHPLDFAPEIGGGVHYGTGVKVSPDGKQVAVWSGPGTRVLVCDVESNAKPRVFDGGMSRPTAVAFSPNNAVLVVGYNDGTALVWDLAKK